ncbi:hypothetical protein V7138_20900 [Bacillus sp. JJ1533]|uniref:hypothetical protein n=1 Tax=Bacillus sp. JJ1533 TaxID=3122959 RepID=UPI002FFE5409
MYRIISFIIIFSIVSTMLYFHNKSSHLSAANHEILHQINQIIIPPLHPAPAITGSVVQDPSGTWLLEINTEHFKFEPKKAGSNVITFNEGHAHIYLNGKKINRLYGQFYHLDKLPSGKHHIKVTLNGNNHGVFMVNGEEVAYRETVHIP